MFCGTIMDIGTFVYVTVCKCVFVPYSMETLVVISCLCNLFLPPRSCASWQLEMNAFCLCRAKVWCLERETGVATAKVKSEQLFTCLR